MAAEAVSKASIRVFRSFRKGGWAVSGQQRPVRACYKVLSAICGGSLNSTVVPQKCSPEACVGVPKCQGFSPTKLALACWCVKVGFESARFAQLSNSGANPASTFHRRPKTTPKRVRRPCLHVHELLEEFWNALEIEDVRQQRPVAVGGPFQSLP